MIKRIHLLLFTALAVRTFCGPGSAAAAQPWALILIPQSGQDSVEPPWLALLAKHPSLRLTVAVSPGEMRDLSPFREDILRRRDEGRLELALRLTGDPPLPLIDNLELAKLFMSEKVPLPQRPMAWHEDVVNQIDRSRLDYRDFTGAPPQGFVPGGGSMSAPVADVLKSQGFLWTVAGFPAGEWPEGSALAAEGRERGELWVFGSHPAANLLYETTRDPCCSSAGSIAAGMRKTLDKLAKPAVVVFDEPNAMPSLEGFIDSLFAGEAGPMVLVSELARDRDADRDSADLQIWPYSWPWLRGRGNPAGPGLTAWIGDPEKNAAWELLAQTRESISQYKDSGSADIEKLDRALAEFYLAQSGSLFEWLGADEDPAKGDSLPSRLRPEKEMLFKASLENVYRHMGRPIPKFLEGGREVRPRQGFPEAAAPAEGGGNAPAKTVREDGANAIVWTEPDLPSAEAEPSGAEGWPAVKSFSVEAAGGAEEDPSVRFSFTFERSLPPGAALDLYIDINHRAGAGATALLPGRGATVGSRDGWELVLVSRKRETGRWESALHRAGSGAPAFRASFQEQESADGPVCRVSIPKRLLGRNPTQWGYLVCVMRSDEGPMMDFMSAAKHKSNLLALLSQRDATQRISLPMMRQEVH